MRSLVLLFLLMIAAAAHAQTPDNVLLVVNEASSVSLEVGQYYAQKRGVPTQNMLRLKTALTDDISREEFEQQIEFPIMSWITRNSAQDRILYIVLTKGIPLRVQGTSGPTGTIASVDSELTVIYPKLEGMRVPQPGPINNPYFLGSGAIASASQFSHEKLEIYLVSRLDGYTSADIRGLIDRGVAPAKEGKILLDAKGVNDKGDDWLKMAADWMSTHGFEDRVVLDTTSNVLKDQTGVLGYYSWGSNDPAIKVRHFNLVFVPGALAGMFVSSDGRTFREPPESWNVGPWEDKSTYFAGSPQSLAGDLIRDGITGVAGHVSEPYLEASIRPDILFPAYLSGFNLVESYYLAMPRLSWQTVIIGDPLCAPFRTRSLTPQQIDKGIDPEIELPGYFGARKLRLASVSPVKEGAPHPETTKLLVRADARLAKQDHAGARLDLEKATALDAKLTNAQLLLAALYEKNKEYTLAIERYRKVLEFEPGSVVALNNLAYALAVYANSLPEALELAEKAYGLQKTNASVIDTLGWVYHLRGDNARARELLNEAVLGAPTSADIHLHLASVSAALGQTQQAAAELARALALDPTLQTSPEVQALRQKIKGKSAYYELPREPKLTRQWPRRSREYIAKPEISRL